MAVPAQVLAVPSSDQEAEAGRRIVARAMWIGVWVWPSFLLLDAYMCFVAYPGAPFGRFVVYRVIVQLAFLGVYHAARTGTGPLKRLYWLQNMTYGAAALGISVMAIDLGGIRSPYMHGISIVALVRAALVPAHWRHSLHTFARIGLAFPLVMGFGALFSQDARAEWLSADALTAFASNYVFVLASSALGLIICHMVWSAQEQVYRARRVGRYRLQAPIGKGGMGEVWLAWDLSLHRNVALKLLRTGAIATPAAVRRFEREAQATGQLRGPHIVQIFDFGASDDGLYYIAMEYLNGMDLGTLVERFGPLPPSRAIRIGMQACLALEEAHGAGIIHRDLKPHNLFLTRVGADPDFVKLLDFGVVRIRTPEPGGENLTGTGRLIGTPAYLAPELWLGAEADERSDLYALGVTLHYLVTGVEALPGRPPEPGTAGLIPEPLAALLGRCMALRPEDRVRSARALSDALALLHDRSPWTPEDAEAFWRNVPGAATAGPPAP